jgi:cytidylate kinase
VLCSEVVRRVSVIGNSGAGKSTVARHLAAVLGVPHLELDAVFHQPGWRPLPDEEFRRITTAKASDPANAHMRFIRLTSRRDVRRFLDETRRGESRRDGTVVTPPRVPKARR